MTKKRFSHQADCEAPTVSELQKELIRKAILKSISITPYYDGLELKACNAISTINKFSDGRVNKEIIDNCSGEIYQKVS